MKETNKFELSLNVFKQKIGINDQLFFSTIFANNYN